MVGLKCCVHGCYSSSTHNTNTTFFSFPPDTERWTLWLHAIGRDDLLEKFQNDKSRSYRVCSDHFKEENFVYRKNLKPNVVPTRNLPARLNPLEEVSIKNSVQNASNKNNLSTDGIPVTTSDLRSDLENRNSSVDITNLDNNTILTTYSNSAFEGTSLGIFDQSATTNASIDCTNQTIEESHDLNTPTESTTRNHSELDNLTCVSPMQLSSDSLVKRKAKDEITYQKKIKRETSYNPLNTDNDSEPRPVAMKKFLEYCDRFLDEKMAEIVKCNARIVEKFKGNRYTMEFKLFALNLYFRCPQSYRFLEHYFHLPSIRTLQRMHIPISSGLNPQFLKALESKIQCMSEKEKVCSVCVNAMNIKPNDPSKEKKNGLPDIDHIEGSELAKVAVILVAKGLFTNWQQPIAFELKPENTNYPELTHWIDHVIATLLEIGLDVRALTTDLSWDFYNSSKLRSISKDKTHFEVNGHKIFYIFDAPNLIKSARNNLMRYHFNFGNKIAKWEHIEAIYERDSAHELKLMPKISEKHIKPNQLDKQRIKFATQVFSYSMAAALQFYVKARLMENGANDTKDLVKHFNDIFDILNSETVTNDYVHKRAYKGNNEQKKFLTEALNFFESLILVEPMTNKAVSNIDFIEGFIITIKSIMGLHDGLKEQGHPYILTKNLNQDCIEDVFNQIRLNCKEPTALQFSRSFRNIFLTNILKTTTTKEANCDDDLTTILFKLKDIKE